MKKLYAVSASNSTVNGDPGKHYDWNKFSWMEVKHRNILRAGPEYYTAKPFVDGNATQYYEYIHVPWDFQDNGTIFRVRPHFQVGQKRWGKIVTAVHAVEKQHVWYWEITLENSPEASAQRGKK